MEAQQAEQIRATLLACGWNISRVCRELGIPRQSLYRKLKRHGITRRSPPEFHDPEG